MTDKFDSSKRAINVSYKTTAALKKIIGKDEFADLQTCIAKAKGYLPWGNNHYYGDADFIQSIENKFQAPFEQLVSLADPGNPLKEVIELAKLALSLDEGFMPDARRKRAFECIGLVEGSIKS